MLKTAAKNENSLFLLLIDNTFSCAIIFMEVIVVY